MSLYPMIKVCLGNDRQGFVIAVTKPAGGYSGAVLAVGTVLRIDGDDEPEAWQAWLWPQPGSNLHVTQHCDAETAPSRATLLHKLVKRAARDGAWWQ